MSENNSNIYDLVVVGGGVAALSSALYAGRYKMSTIMFTDSFGGVTSTAHTIWNYPGFLEITGMDLISKMVEQINNLNIPIKYEKVMDIKKQDDVFIINTDQETVKAKKVLLAIGKKKRALNIENEDKFLGKGVHYCATCDGAFYKDKVVGVIGGSDAAVTAALLLSEIAKKVYLIYRGSQLRAEPMWLDSLFKQENVEIVYNSEIKELIGSEKLEKIKLKDDTEMALDGIFIEIGHVPNTELLDKLSIQLDDHGEIIVDKAQRTNVEGVFAAGDCTNHTELKQIVTSTSQGAIASYHMFLDIKSGK
ncbi:MAG: FAD-dependent oxidoreductase [Candidatus ainarchaeum sp.]|nr:FAD-dependent oxidoreductase [Candidatus ainarchaeum sp.]